MIAGASALPLEVDPLIAEAKQRARRRRLLVLIAAGLVAAGLLAFELAPTSTGGGANGAIPWLPTLPNTGPANPPLAAPCTAAQLHATLFVQGAAGNLAAGIHLMNRSSTACALVGRPNVSLAGWRVTRWRQRGGALAYDPLAPPIGSLRALRRGEHVSVLLWIPGYCRMDPAVKSHPRPLVLTAPGGGTVALNHATFLSCNAPAALPVQATRYTPFVPQGMPSSELPLSARIVSSGPRDVNGKRVVGPTLVAHAGSWLSYTVVLKNHSGRVLRFGKTCPSYTEGFTRQVGYVLNCHPVGAIGPGKSVRFAMRIRVPTHVDNLSALGWWLAPHSYNAPQSLAVVDLH